MKPLKILIDLGKLKNRNVGLGEVSYQFATHLAQHATALHKKEIQLYYLVPSEYVGKFGNEVSYISLSFWRRNFSFLNKGFDLWHALHQDSFYMPSKNEGKYLLTIHDLNVAQHNNPQKAEKRLQIIQKRIDQACQIITISNFTKEEVIAKMKIGNKPIEVIYNGVADGSKVATQKPLGIDIPEKYLFHLSSNAPKKNTAVLLDLMKQMPDKNLIIAGSWNNPYAQNILRRIKDENLPNIFILNQITQEEKGWLYQHCDGFLFPSLLEGFGLPIIEAMYWGKPVFCSNLTSLPEIGADKAFYWESFEPDAMKKVLETGLNQYQGQTDSREQLRAYAQRFSWKENANAYLALYLKILKN